MTETLRAQIEDPTQMQEAAQAASNPQQALPHLESIQEHQGVVRNPVTITDPATAYDVAHAVKPEIDAIADAKTAQADPYAKAAHLPGVGYVGVADVAAEKTKQVAAEIDLERNIESATDTHIKQKMGNIVVRGAR